MAAVNVTVAASHCTGCTGGHTTRPVRAMADGFVVGSAEVNGLHHRYCAQPEHGGRCS